jgi:hypothetical protein
VYEFVEDVSVEVLALSAYFNSILLLSFRVPKELVLWYSAVNIFLESTGIPIEVIFVDVYIFTSGVMVSALAQDWGGHWFESHVQ